MSHYKEYGISLLKNVSYYVLMQCSLLLLMAAFGYLSVFMAL